MMYAVEMSSVAMIYIPSIIMIGSCIQNGGGGGIQRRDGVNINLL
jgi:hypothetical protein